jgi:hypothetical protein
MGTMAFERRTNLGSLLAAVLVGLLALAVNQVFKSSPEEVETLLTQIHKSTEAGWEQFLSPRLPARRLHQLIDCQRRLGRVYQSWSGIGGVLPERKIRETVARAQATSAILEQTPELTRKQGKLAESAMLAVYFMAAEMLPDQYSSQFLELSGCLLESAATPDEVARIEHLRLYHAYRFNEPDDLRLLKKLREFSQDVTDAKAGVPIYLTVTADLVTQGRTHLARAVLLQGSSMYYGQKPTRRLVDQLVLLQIQRK